MKTRRALLIALLALATTAGVAVATHTSVGLTSSLLARGTLSKADLRQFTNELKDLRRLPSSTVATVKATLLPGGTTDWHAHPGPSIVVVTAGTIRVTEPIWRGGDDDDDDGGRRITGCRVTDYTAVPTAAPPFFPAFFHEQSAHNFTNPSSMTAEFYVTYFAPAGPLLLEPVPAC